MHLNPNELFDSHEAVHVCGMMIMWDLISFLTFCRCRYVVRHLLFTIYVDLNWLLLFMFKYGVLPPIIYDTHYPHTYQLLRCWQQVFPYSLGIWLLLVIISKIISNSWWNDLQGSMQSRGKFLCVLKARMQWLILKSWQMATGAQCPITYELTSTDQHFLLSML